MSLLICFYLTQERDNFSCSYCEKKFTQQRILKQHEMIHTGEKPFRCSFCDYRGRQENSLRIHVRTHHTGDKPFSCSYCQKKFRQAANMQRHEKIHTGDKPFGCSNCNMKFITKIQLKKARCRRNLERR